MSVHSLILFRYKIKLGNLIFTRGLSSRRRNKNYLRGVIPGEVIKTLEERLKELDVSDPELNAPVDIGLPIIIKSVSPKSENSDPDRKLQSKESLFQAAISKNLKVDLDVVKADWKTNGLLESIREVAKHYGVFSDLFRHGIFTPRVPLRVNYNYDDNLVTPVHRGNILQACETSCVPEVFFESGPDDYWTLVLTNPDGHFNDNSAEYLHWFISNIKGNDLSSGEELVPYLQPFPPKGTGYHRMIFILYKQEAGRVDFRSPKKVSHSHKLKERTFSTFDFYKDHQEVITPAGLSFFQATWDNSLTDFFHNILQMREPVFEYSAKPMHLERQTKYPAKKPFNQYLNRYRPVKEMNAEVLLKRLKMVEPFKEDSPMSKYPNLHPMNVPSWLIADTWKERNRIGRFKDLRPFSIHGHPEFNFQKEMFEKDIRKSKA